mmetsp:Transcript_19641/g.35730  ORF Transcript_19641/g.35730 Transcript_19641/m.35730 type:complete len:342 (-) Transcript_19641:46-1071(-)
MSEVPQSSGPDPWADDGARPSKLPKSPRGVCLPPGLGHGFGGFGQAAFSRAPPSYLAETTPEAPWVETLNVERAALTQENERFSARLEHARLTQENSMLAQENAFLQMQMQSQIASWAPSASPQAVQPAATWSSLWSGPKGLLLGTESIDCVSHSSSLESTTAGSSCGGSALGVMSPRGSSRASVGSDDTKVRHTTVMMRNLPNNYTRTMLLELLDTQGFWGGYNMVYLPMDFSSAAGFGYAFINFVTSEGAEHFRDHFQGFSEWSVPSEKICDVMWSGVHQGLEAHIERYRNSPVMHQSVPDEFKPALFVNGERVPFPSPSKPPRAPRIRAPRVRSRPTV